VDIKPDKRNPTNVSIDDGPHPMGNSPSDEPVAGGQSGSDQQPPADLLDSDQDIAYQEIIAPPAAEARGRDVIIATRQLG